MTEIYVEAGVDRNRVEEIVARVRPAIQADGGDIEVVDVEGANLFVRLTGKCVGCPSSERTLRDGLLVRLQRELTGLERVIAVN
jgi:Fe-S cluster biogenesis protein NfuA